MSGKSGQRPRPNRLQEVRPAPGELRLVQAFLNTADFVTGTDELAGLGELASWLERHMLLPPEPELEACA